MSKLFGWVPPATRTVAQHEANARAMSYALPHLRFVDGTYRETKGRFPLWRALQKVLKRETLQNLLFAWQVTGSCVGAGGNNMLAVKMACEIVTGQLEEWKQIWWPFTYGRSRFRGGMRSPGEGSMGSTWAEAATADGFMYVQDKPGLTFQTKSDWVQLSAATERSWSDGDAQQTMECLPIGQNHLIKSYTPIRNSDEAKAALANDTPLTLASNFGTRGPRPVGTPQIYLADWDDTWPHQMSCNEAWDHPTEGLVFRIQNNWGPDAHPKMADGPFGSFYVKAATFDRICRGNEVFAFSGDYNGLKLSKIDWTNVL